MQVVLFDIYIDLQQGEFCKSYAPGTTHNLWTRKLCKLDYAEIALALQCKKIPSQEARMLVEEGNCFKGINNEDVLEHLITLNPGLKQKLRGSCGAECKKKSTATLNEIKELQDNITSIMDERIQTLNTTKAVYSRLKTRMVEYHKSVSPKSQNGLAHTNEISFQSIKDDLTKSIGTSSLNDKDKNELTTDVLKWATTFGNTTGAQMPTLITGISDLIEKIGNGINGTEQEKIKIEKRVNKVQGYLKNLGDRSMKVLDKLLPALTSCQSAVKKFSSGGVVNVIGGILDVSSAISNFLPPPASSIMGPIAGIFNSVFGMGSGPSPVDVINDGFRKQKEYLEKEFKALNSKIATQTVRLEGKIDRQTEKLLDKMEEIADDQLRELQRIEKEILKQIDDKALEQKIRTRNDDMEKVLIDQNTAQLKLTKYHIYFGPLEDISLDSDATIFLGTQIDSFEGQKEYENTKRYIEKYCKATSLHLLDVMEMKLCSGIIFHWTTTATLMEGIMVKFIALLRLSNINNNVELARAKTALLIHQRKNTKKFLREIFYDTRDYCTRGGYGIYGCLANGETALLDEGHRFNMTQEQRNLFQTQFGMTEDFACSNKQETLGNCGKYE